MTARYSAFAFLWLAAFVFARPVSSAPAGVRLLENTSQRIVFEYQLGPWELRDVSEAGENWQRIVAPGDPMPTLRAGWPEVPVIAVRLGIPFDVTPRLEVQVLEEAARAGVRLIPAPTDWFDTIPPRQEGGKDVGEGWKVPRSRIEAAAGAYASGSPFPEAVAELRPPGSYRHQRVATVVCNPFRYVAGRRELLVARKIRVTLHLAPDAGVPGAGRAPGTGYLPAPAERPEVEAVYGTTLLNAAESRPWRRRGAALQPAARAAGGGYSPNPLEYRLTIAESGIYRVSFADLPGFPAGVPIANIKVFQRRYQGGSPPIVEDRIPLRVGDAGTLGIFDAGDGFFFFARSFREQFVTGNQATGSQADPPGDWEDTYTDRNVYWLSYESGGGSPPVPAEAAMKGFAAPAVPAAFEATAFGERDSLHFDFQRRREMDPDFWVPDGVQVPFNVPGIVNTQPVEMTVRLLYGYAYAQVLPTYASRAVDLFIVQPGGGRVPVGNITLQDNGLVEDFETTLASPGYLNGQQSFAVLDTLRTGPATAEGWIDWYRFRYQRAYRLESYENRLRMTNGGMTGQLEFRVGGLAGSAVTVYRLDPDGNPTFLTAPQVTSEGGGTFEARFQDDVAGETEYFAMAANAHLSPLGISRIEGQPDLVNDDALAPDYLMIAHDPFLPGVQPLADYRTSHGHRVRLTTASRVYDLFGNGSPSPQAIKNYIRHAYETWNTAYVLLVGDGSRDERGTGNDESYVGNRSDPNFIPTYYLLDRPPEDRYFLRAHDNWYGDLSPDSDWIAEISLGRFPVGNLGELETLVQKTIAFEQDHLDEPWRRRVVWLADDDYVFEGGLSTSCSSTLQRDFAGATSEMITMLGASAAGGMTSDYFRLKSWTDQHDPDQRCDNGCCVSASDAIDWTRANATPALIDMLNQNELIWNYQGHANREVFTHEYIYHEEPVYFSNPDLDSDRFTNRERPFICLGYACYISMFDWRPESILGDGIGERMLLEPEGGAVALYASPGLEYLTQNTYLNKALVSSMWSPAYYPGGGAGMVLGPCITAGVQLFSAGPYGGESSYRAYHILGDPALRIEAGPPMMTVTVNDSLAADGDFLADFVTGGTAEIVADVADEGGLAALTVTNTLISSDPLTPGVDYQVEALADSGHARPRRQRITYTTAATLQDYDIVIAAEDPNGNRRSFTLQSGLSVSVESEGVELVDGIELPPRPELRVRVASPVPIDGDLLGLRLDGEVRDDVIRTPLAAREGGRGGGPMLGGAMLADSSSRWELALPPLDLALGPHLLEVTFQPGDSLMVMASVRFVLRADVSFGYAFCYPNPFTQGTTFVFELSPAAESVEMQIYTVAGRKICTLESGPTAPAPGAQNHIAWNGRDNAGDEVANGVYVFRARARSAVGLVTTHQGQVVKISGAR